MIYIPEPLDLERYKFAEPIDAAKLLVIAGWDEMNQENEEDNSHCDEAYALNFGGYMAGHPEGASNVGLIILSERLSDELFEMVCGEHDSTEVAEAWFSRALEGRCHSPQAEISLAKIAAAKPFCPENVKLAEMYTNLAIKNANNPDSLWADERQNFLEEIDMVANKIFQRFERLQFESLVKKRLH
jgi:hypothetical protein